MIGVGGRSRMAGSTGSIPHRTVDKKFLNLILVPQFCGICIENTTDLQPVHTRFVICGRKLINISLDKMISEVFKDINILLNQFVCKHCIEKIIKFFRFIHTTKESRTALSCYVSDCYAKAVDLSEHVHSLDGSGKQATEGFIRLTGVESRDCKNEYKTEKTALSKHSKFELESVNVTPAKLRQNELKIFTVTSGSVKRRHYETDSDYETESLPVESSYVKRRKVEKHKVQQKGLSLKKEKTQKQQKKELSIKKEKTQKQTRGKCSKGTKVKKIKKEKRIKPIISKNVYATAMQIKPDGKKEFKCSFCKIALPTYRLWQAHRKEHKTVPICKICSKVFLTAGRLIVHYKQHNKLKCKICKLLVTDSDLNEHLKINHGNVTHACDKCGKLFYTANALKVHKSVAHPSESQSNGENLDANPLCLLCQHNFKKDEINSHRCKGRCPECPEKQCIHYKYLVSFSEQTSNKLSKVKCVDCDYVCVKKIALISHVNHAHLNHLPFVCNDCGTKFTTKYTLQNHIYRSHMPECVCKFCDKYLTSMTGLKTHIAKCEANPRPVKCCLCPASFVNQAKLTIHGRLRHSLDYYACDNQNCNQKFLTEETLRRHKKATHGAMQLVQKRSPWWYCGKCDKKFDRKVECEMHRETQHDSDEKYKCFTCQKEFDNLKSYRRHTHNHKLPDLRKKKFECGRCELSFGTIEQCTRHRETHDPRDMFKCRKCNKEFETAEMFRAHTYRHSLQSKQACEVCGKLVINLAGHMETHVTEGKNSICDKCGKRFKNDFRLKAHQSVHSDYTVRCEVCGKMIKSGRLYYHMERHTKTERWSVNCEYCNKKVTKKNYEAHVNGHHLFIRPYSCNTCNKKFHAENNLKVHLKLHKELKMFVCEVCNKIFHSPKGLERHGLLHTGERPFTCDICGRGFITITRMKDHRRKHFAKTVPCPICNSMFYAANLMRSHFKKVHWKDKDKKYDPLSLVSEEYHYLFEDRRKPPVKNSSS